MGLIIFISGSPYYCLDGYDLIRTIMPFVLIAILAVPVVSNLIYTFKTKKSLLIVSVCAVCLWAIFVLNSSNDMIKFLSKIVIFILLIFYISNNNNSERLFSCLYKYTIIICIIALLHWVLLYVYEFQMPYTIVEGGRVRDFHFLFYDNPEWYREHIGSFYYCRLQGFFWEPGVLGIYIVVALYHYIYNCSNKKLWVLFILLISLVLTESTTGLMIGSVLVGFHYLKKIKNKKIKLMIVIPVLILAVLAVTYFWSTKKNSASASYSIRTRELVVGLQIWLDNFFLGTGYNNTYLFKSILGAGSSNGFINWCTTMGLLGFLVIMVPFVANCIIGNRKNRRKSIVWMIIWILINMTEPLMTSPLMIFFLSNEYYTALKHKNEMNANSDLLSRKIFQVN